MSDVDKLSESTGKEILFFWQILFYGILSNIWWWCRTGKKRRKKNTFKSTENPKNSTRRLISRQKKQKGQLAKATSVSAIANKEVTLEDQMF
jgi:hypothetical protein